MLLDLAHFFRDVGIILTNNVDIKAVTTGTSGAMYFIKVTASATFLSTALEASLQTIHVSA